MTANNSSIDFETKKEHECREAIKSFGKRTKLQLIDIIGTHNTVIVDKIIERLRKDNKIIIIGNSFFHADSEQLIEETG